MSEAIRRHQWSSVVLTCQRDGARSTRVCWKMTSTSGCAGRMVMLGSRLSCARVWAPVHCVVTAANGTCGRRRASVIKTARPFSGAGLTSVTYRWDGSHGLIAGGSERETPVAAPDTAPVVCEPAVVGTWK